MSTRPIADQAAGMDAGCGLDLLAHPILDPIFRPQVRSGLASAWHTHVPFAQWLVSATRPALIVELGTHNGISYAAFCETVLQEKIATRCYAVDSWAGDDHAGHYDESVYADLRAFHDGRYSAFSELLRMTFDEAREVIADGSVDLLHIDGFHSYDAVRHDFESWAPKLSPRAVVLFHDTNVLERDFGVARFWAEVNGLFPSFSFLHGHGLGVLAVGADVPAAISRLCAPLAPSAVATLRERFATLGRGHGLDHALRQSAQRVQRLRREAAERDGTVESLRSSLEEVLRHRDSLLATQGLPSEGATMTSLRAALRDSEAATGDARDEVARMAAAAQEHARRMDERDRTIGGLQAQALENRATLDRLRAEIEALSGHLAAARADAHAARADGRAGIDQPESATAAPRAAAEVEPTPVRALFGLPARRH